MSLIENFKKDWRVASLKEKVAYCTINSLGILSAIAGLILLINDNLLWTLCFALYFILLVVPWRDKNTKTGKQ